MLGQLDQGDHSRQAREARRVVWQSIVGRKPNTSKQRGREEIVSMKGNRKTGLCGPELTGKTDVEVGNDETASCCMLLLCPGEQNGMHILCK